MTNTKEVRTRRGELRFSDTDGSRSIEGYAVVWGELSSALLCGPSGQGFWEKVAPGAFDLDGADVACLCNHDDTLILGRTSAGTLTLEADDHGLRFRCSLPNTSYANDLAESLGRRDIQGCSFGFQCVEDSWAKDDQGMPVRTIVKASLFDVSPVTYPTYTGTEVALRSLNHWESARDDTAAIAWYERTIRALRLLELTGKN